MTKEHIVPIVRANIDRESHLMTDEARRYESVARSFPSMTRLTILARVWLHRRTGTKINTNTIEGYYSIFKRGMIAIYQHCSEKHLHRYLAEYDFRYSNRVRLGVNDAERSERALVGVKGKRLTYHQPH